MKTAILFAGQGAQHVGMGKDFYAEYLRFRQVFDLLPEEQRRIAFEGPMEELKKTENTQPIMLAFALSLLRESSTTKQRSNLLRSAESRWRRLQRERIP